MKTATQLLADKSSVVWSLAPDSSVFDAIKLMAEKEIGALLVIKDRLLVGIISERDYARKVILQGKSSRGTPISEIMSSDVVTVTPGATIEHCMSVMTENKIRHLPVMDHGVVIGVLSIGDLVKAIIAEQSDTIAHLEEYIRS